MEKKDCKHSFIWDQMDARLTGIERSIVELKESVKKVSSEERDVEGLKNSLISCILNNPDLNISWIPDSVERDMYELLLGFITNL